jgi:hypothetical protein
MKPEPLVLTLPAEDADLRDEISQGIEAYADVDASPKTLGGETFHMILDVVNTGLGIAGSLAAILAYLQELQKRKQATGHTLTISIGKAGGTQFRLDQASDDLLGLLLEQILGTYSEETPPVQPATPKSDLEASIRKTYALLREYKEKLQLSNDPAEQARFRNAIAEQQETIKDYQAQYVQLCKKLNVDMVEDIAAIAIILDLEFSGKR